VSIKRLWLYHSLSWLCGISYTQTTSIDVGCWSRWMTLCCCNPVCLSVCLSTSLSVTEIRASDCQFICNAESLIMILFVSCAVNPRAAFPTELSTNQSQHAAQLQHHITQSYVSYISMTSARSDIFVAEEDGRQASLIAGRSCCWCRLVVVYGRSDRVLSGVRNCDW